MSGRKDFAKKKTMSRQNNVMSSEINSGVHNNLFQNLTTAVVAAATKKDEFSVQENPHHHVNTLANYTNMTTLGKNIVFFSFQMYFRTLLLSLRSGIIFV
jgi:hypothetical protein